MSANPFTILKRTPVPKRRSKPRRDRLVDKDFLRFMATQPCLIEGKSGHVCVGRITLHHVREYGSTKSDRRVLALCEGAHLYQAGPDAIERLGKARWQAKFVVNIQLEIARYNEGYVTEVLSVPPTPKPNELPWKFEVGATRRRMEREELYG